MSSRSDWSILIFVLLLSVIALTGGSSRVDSAAQVGPRLIGICAIAAVFLLDLKPAVDCRLAVRFVVILIGLVALQLIPLPPSWWQNLPGRSVLAYGDNILSLSIWRPISLVPDLTLDALLSTIPVFATVICYGVLRCEARYLAVSAVLTIVAASALLGGAQLAGGPASPLRYYELHGDGAVGLFANRNHAGLLLAVGIPALATWGEIRERQKNHAFRRLAFVGCAVVLTILLLLNGSRSGLALGFAGIIIAAAMLVWENNGGVVRKVSRWGSAVLALIVLIAGVTMTFRPTVLTRFAEIGMGDDLRRSLLPWLWRMASDYFPFGSGFGTFPVVYRQYEPFELLRVEYLNAAHNDWAQILIEGGIFGAALIAAFLAWWVRATLWVWSSAGVVLDRKIGRLGWTITAFIMVASVVDYPLRTPLVASLFALGCCMMQVAGDRKRPSDVGHGALPAT